MSYGDHKRRNGQPREVDHRTGHGFGRKPGYKHTLDEKIRIGQSVKEHTSPETIAARGKHISVGKRLAVLRRQYGVESNKTIEDLLEQIDNERVKR